MVGMIRFFKDRNISYQTEGRYLYYNFEDIYNEGKDTKAQLQPKDKTLLKYIKEIHLFFSSDASVDRVKLIEPTDDYTEITFTHKQFNTPIDDSVFAL